jgi:hypothetical protein
LISSERLPARFGGACSAISRTPSRKVALAVDGSAPSGSGIVR